MDKDKSEYWPGGYPVKDHTRKDLQLIAAEIDAEPDAVVAEAEKAIAGYYHLRAFQDDLEGAPAEQRDALADLSKKANELADAIDRLSMISFVIAVDPGKGRYKKSDKLTVSNSYRALGDRAKRSSDALIGYRKGQALSGPGETPRENDLHYRDLLIGDLSRAYRRLTGKKKIKGIKREPPYDPFSRLANAVLLDIRGIQVPDGKRLEDIVRAAPETPP
ncbi:MAG: hypothetical protein O2868_03225 [Proteobacteria bacterium]|nr:hypothetical protein [Pseudomonadota bacterium]